MATNYVSQGAVIDFANTGSAITSGSAVVVGANLGVALVDIDATTGAGAVQIEGVFELPKVSADTITQGQALTWDVSEGKLTEQAPANGDVVGCCFAFAAAGDGATTVLAKLTPGAGSVHSGS